MLGLVSCEPNNDDVEVATLQLSEKTLTFDKVGGEQSVSVTTNQANWTAFSAQEGQWVTLDKEGNSLKVTVAPNVGGEDRNGFVIVTAGGATERIELEQAQADIVLDVDPSELTFPQKGGEKRISIASNTEDWTIEPVEELDWLTIKRSGTLVFVTAAPNETDAAREAKLIAKSGTKLEEIPVKQLTLDKYILPLMDVSAPEDIIRAETARGSILLGFSRPGEFFGSSYPGTVVVIPNTPIFETITYRIPFVEDTEKIPLYWDMAICEAKHWLDISSQEFRDFVVASGFTQETEGQSEKRMTYLNEEGNLRLSILSSNVEGKEECSVTIEIVIKQDNEYPSFSTLPKPLHEYLEVKKVEDVKAWAAEHGYTQTGEAPGNVVPEHTFALVFEKEKTAEEEPAGIIVFFYSESNDEVITPEKVGYMRQYQIAYPEGLNRMMWRLPNGKWRVTHEYEKVLGEGGYPRLLGENPDDNLYFYCDEADNIAGVDHNQYPDLFGGKEFVRTMYWYEAGASAGGASESGLSLQIALDPFKFLKGLR